MRIMSMAGLWLMRHGYFLYPTKFYCRRPVKFSFKD